VNRGFSKDIKAGRTAFVQLILDGSDSNTASVILSYANKIIGRYSSGILNVKARILFQNSKDIPVWT
jgi:ABC-2 type transport system permease protein